MKKLINVSLIAHTALNNELFIDYGAEGEGKQLFKYFHGIHNGFYVDIGAFDPIFCSNTLNLHIQGWKGINIDANQQRLSAFNLLRFSDVNIHSAIGDSNTFVTLYEMDNDSTATVSEKVKQLQIDQKQRKVVQQLRVPSMSMKELCNKFFLKRPLFLSLDVEGYGAKVLMENDWADQKCRPEIIFSQNNFLSQNSGLPPCQQILVENGYVKMAEKVGFNQVFISQQKFHNYVEKYTEGSRLLSEKNVIQFFPIINSLSSYLNIGYIQKRHYNMKKDPIYCYFARVGKPIDLQQIQNQNQHYDQSGISMRPNVIFHYDPSNIIFINSEYKKQKINVGNGFEFFKVRVTKGEKYFDTYIFDHKLKPSLQLTIISAQHKNKPIQNPNNENINNKKKKETKHYDWIDWVLISSLIVILVFLGNEEWKKGRQIMKKRKIRVKVMRQKNNDYTKVKNHEDIVHVKVMKS